MQVCVLLWYAGVTVYVYLYVVCNVYATMYVNVLC
jgi:hypothetical protein